MVLTLGRALGIVGSAQSARLAATRSTAYRKRGRRPSIVGRGQGNTSERALSEMGMRPARLDQALTSVLACVAEG